MSNPGPSSSTSSNTSGSAASPLISSSSLPTASSVVPNTTIMTSDLGLMVSNGSQWAPVASARSYVPRLNNSGTHRLQSWPFVNGFSGFTFQNVLSIPAISEPILVRAVFENDQTALTFPVNAIAIASGSAFADPNPLLPDGVSNSPWTLSTTVPITVPVADAGVATNGINGIAASEWMSLNMIARRDGGINGLVYVRATFGANSRMLDGNVSFPFGDYSLLNNNLQFSTTTKSGDFTSSNQTGFVAPFVAGALWIPCYLQIMANKNVRTWFSVGDSYALGDTSVGGMNDYILQAANSLSTPFNAICVQKLGLSGQTFVKFTSAATALLANALFNRPSLVFIQPFSINTAGEYTPANVNAAWPVTLQLANLVSSLGGVPVLKTMQPVTAHSAAQELVRLAFNAQIRQSTLPYVDVDAVVSNNKTPVADFLPGYSNDGKHLNDLGQAAVVPQLLQVLQRYGLL